MRAENSETDLVRVRIERIVPGGLGLARNDGRVMLVPMTAPGDLAEVIPVEQGPGARLVRIVEPGADRHRPGCRHYGACGGCDLMHLSYDGQLAAKRNIVLDALRRTGGIDWTRPLEIIANPVPMGSRNRAAWQPAADRTAGYFRRSSRDVVRIESCPVLDPALERARAELRLNRQIQALSNGADVSIDSEGFAKEIEFHVAGERYRTSARAFFQSNLALLEQFVTQVRNEIDATSGARVLELYSGIGLFTVPIARRVASVQSVESDPVAHRFAVSNLAASGIANARATCDSAERWLGGCREPFDTVLVDPPRSGLSRSVRAAIARLLPEQILYVSCDPVTFARDARSFVEHGYRIERLTGFDMFPQTHHVELVASLRRAPGPAG